MAITELHINPYIMSKLRLAFYEDMIDYVSFRTGVYDIKLGQLTYKPWYILRIPGET